MDTIKFVEQCLNEVHERLTKSLQGLSAEAFLWRPAPHANCIAEITWHLARSEDRMARPRMGLGAELWESQEWYHRFGCPKEQTRETDYQILRKPGLPAPKLDDLLAYIEAIHEDTLGKLHTLMPNDWGRAPDPSCPERTIALYFRHLIVHNNNHHGQIDYIRGLFQIGWDLPPGTGIVQP